MKIGKILAALLCLAVLTGCGREREIVGEVTQFQDGGFAVTTETGREYAVDLTEESLVLSWVDSITREDFLAGQWEGVFVTVRYEKSAGKYHAEQVMIDGLRRENAMQLSDGTPISILERSGSRDYMLEDGTVLLYENIPIGPEHVHTGATLGFDDLNETAQKNIRAYFDAKGPYYSIPELLEEAYSAYHIMGEAFQARGVHQDIVPTASNDHIICFMTDVLLPGWQDYSISIREGAVFDVKTGAPVSSFDLFACTPEELEAVLVEQIDPEGAYDREKISLGLAPENIVLHYDGSVEIYFQECRIPNHAENFVLGLSPEQASALLQPWAVMEPAE